MSEQIIPENRWHTIQSIWQGNQWLFAVIGYLVGLLSFPALQEVVTNLTGLLSGFVPEAVGIGVTVLFIERLNQRREENRRALEQRERLIRDAGSPVREVAVHTVNEIRKLKMLEGETGILKNVDLSGAYLMKADLSKANLMGADLFSANLAGTDLTKANLAEADMFMANLEGADLVNANLVRAKLKQANMSGADMFMANLEGADLAEANLAGANLRYAQLMRVNLSDANLMGVDLRNANLIDSTCEKTKFNDKTILPDAEHMIEHAFSEIGYDKLWTPDTDMTRYTDPNHPDFWQPAWAKRQNEGK